MLVVEQHNPHHGWPGTRALLPMGRPLVECNSHWRVRTAWHLLKWQVRWIPWRYPTCVKDVDQSSRRDRCWDRPWMGFRTRQVQASWSTLHGTALGSLPVSARQAAQDNLHPSRAERHDYLFGQYCRWWGWSLFESSENVMKVRVVLRFALARPL